MKILIYGVGNMGRVFKDFFHARGYYVKGYDIVKERCEIEEDEIKEFDVIFVCVPMENIKDALDHIASKSSNPLLVDIATVKRISIPIFESYSFDYLSIHPMFGHDARIELSSIIVVKESGRKEEEVILNEFRRCGAIISKLSLDEHERIVAEIQAIPHFILISIANYLRFKKPEYSTLLFNVLHKLASRILNQDWKTYYLIQKNSEHIREKFVKEIAKLHELLKDREKFKELFLELSSIYDDYKDTDMVLEVGKVSRIGSSLDELRGYMSVLDDLILKLIEKRITTGKVIATKKRELNEPIEVSDIEQQKIQEIIRKTRLNPIAISSIFRGIIELTKEEEYKTAGIKRIVAILGPKGSFSEEMALKLIGSRLPLKYYSSIEEVVKAVAEGKADYGIVPIENSINGTVIPTLDALIKYDVEVFGEAKLEINHCLVSKQRLSLRDVKVVYSHPQAIAQCMNFINNYLPHAEVKYTKSTVDAIELLDESSAAIVSELASKLYKLYVLKSNIQDFSGNITRFYIIGKRTGKSEGNITALFFGVEDRPGALKNVLEVFYNKGFNLRKLESRPSRLKLGDYIFFVEIEALLSDEDLKDLKDVTTFYKVVGVFKEIEKLNVYR